MAEEIVRTPFVRPAGSFWVAGAGFRKAVSLGLLVGLSLAIVVEVNLSFLQSRIFSAIALRARATLAPGASNTIGFPKSGPYDTRHGYERIPDLVRRLESHGFRVDAQMQWSPGLQALHALGLAAPVREPNRPGLQLQGHDGTMLFDARGPEGYQKLSDVPPIVVSTLLFIEDRHLLDADPTTRNPAIEWDRLVRALVLLPQSGHGPGGSTLATQLEKLRHSPGGVTHSPLDKLRQMLTASVRAYRDGPDTRDVRADLVVDYLNALPLGGMSGFGEVSGLDRGLVAWFGADPERVNELLRDVTPASDPVTIAESEATALAYRRVLALLIATRRPSVLLTTARSDLERQVDAYLRILAKQDRIPASLARVAAGMSLGFRTPTRAPDRLIERKPAAPVRGPLTTLLGVADLPTLDALDLSVDTTLDARGQRDADALLRSLSSVEAVRSAGLIGPRMLAPSDDPGAIRWSFALYERGEAANLLRLQVDNGTSPLDLHSGVRLDLGSTAKLRTLLLYLELVRTLHTELAGTPEAELHTIVAQAAAVRDRLTEWAASRFLKEPGLSLDALLESALERRYSANPYETFSTGGGTQRFQNFNAQYNDQAVSVRVAFRHSVNLPFIRLMRDIVRYFDARAGTQPGTPSEAQRSVYLARFVDHESKVYLRRFFDRYRELPPDALVDTLSKGRRISARRLAVILRSIAPQRTQPEFAAEMRKYLPSAILDDATLADLYAQFGPDRFSLQDRGYLAGIHPLELWTVAWLREHPRGHWKALLAASEPPRGEAYRWLYRPNRRTAQDKRIAIIREMDAFDEVLRFWRHLGYPFETLTPSYATAIGSAGDRPSSIAELLGILVDDGRRVPTLSIERLRFASGTNFETRLTPVLPPPEQVLSPEVARLARSVLFDVVEQGTGRRARGAFVGPDGVDVAVGGKTGTGDHRYKTFGRNGTLLEERAVSRSAAFAFLIGDRYYGVVSAHTTGAQAAHYRFTSSLAVQMFRKLAPLITEVMEREPSLSPSGSPSTPPHAPPSAPASAAAPSPDRHRESAST